MKAAVIAVMLFSGVTNAQVYHCDVEINDQDIYYITAKVDDRGNQFTVTMENRRDKIRSVTPSPVLDRRESGSMSTEKDNVLYMSMIENGLRGYLIADDKMKVYLLGCE